jgi:hypothetical protein
MKPSKIRQAKRFARWAIDELGIENEPRINYSSEMSIVLNNRSFGSTKPNGEVWVHVGNRNTADIMRTLCHELIHVKQFEDGTASVDMDEEQRQFIEDEANAIAGRMMRTYGKEHAEIYESAKKLEGIIAEALSSHGIRGRSLI